MLWLVLVLVLILEELVSVKTAVSSFIKISHPFFMVEIKRDIIVLRVRRLECKRFNCMELILFYHIDIHVLTLDRDVSIY